MSYEFSVRNDGRLLVVVFEGVIAPEEERAALLETASLPDLRKDACVLVDRRRASMSAGPEDVGPQLNIARRVFADADRPRMAVVAPADYDFAMSRMLELRGDEDLPHELAIFRDFAEACAWLGVDPRELDQSDDAG